MLEPHARIPKVEGAGLRALPIRDIVILSSPQGIVARKLKHFGDRSRVLSNQTVVTGEACSRLSNHTGMHRVVVAPSQESSTSRRAQGSSVELGIPEK